MNMWPGFDANDIFRTFCWCEKYLEFLVPPMFPTILRSVLFGVGRDFLGNTLKEGFTAWSWFGCNSLTILNSSILDKAIFSCKESSRTNIVDTDLRSISQGSCIWFRIQFIGGAYLPYQTSKMSSILAVLLVQRKLSAMIELWSNESTKCWVCLDPTANRQDDKPRMLFTNEGKIGLGWSKPNQPIDQVNIWWMFVGSEDET